MRPRHTVVVVLAILLVAATWRPAGGATGARGQKGDPPAAPDFSLTAYGGGRSVSLSDVRGKVTLLYFFFPT